MWDPTQSVMYLAGRRSVEETPEHRISSSLAEPSHGLLAWEDVVLTPGGTLEKYFDRDVLMLVMPLVGEVDYEDDLRHLFSITAGQILLIPLRAGVKAMVRNPYQDAAVNCLISAVVPVEAPALVTPELIPLHLDRRQDQLQELKNLYLPIYVGRLNGRSEAQVHVPGRKVFVFVVEGAFEVQHRLLEFRDGMTVWNADVLELEALSNNAIVLMVGLGN